MRKIIEDEGTEALIYECLKDEIVLINGQRHLILGFGYRNGFIYLETTQQVAGI